MPAENLPPAGMQPDPIMVTLPAGTVLKYGTRSMIQVTLMQPQTYELRGQHGTELFLKKPGHGAECTLELEFCDLPLGTKR